MSNGIALDEAPLDQAHRFLRKLLKRLADAGCQPPAWGDEASMLADTIAIGRCMAAS